MVDSNPEYHTVQVDAIPAALVRLDQWVCWRFEVRDGKQTKVPYTIYDRRASSTDPATWASFEAVRRRYVECADVDGIGFVLRAGGGIVGVDLDKCRLPDGALRDGSGGIIQRLYSYTEVSPSGTGVHTFVFGKLPGSGRKRQMSWGGAIELYDSGRFLTVTGERLEGAPADVVQRQAELDALYAELFPVALVPTTFAIAPNTVPDIDLLERARRGANGDAFAALYDRGECGDDRSAADLALCNMLMFWTGNDAWRVDALFRCSALMREKWLREDYRIRTLERARQSEVYSGAGKVPKLVRLAGAADDGVATAPIAQPFPDNDTENAELLYQRLDGGVRHVEALGQFYLEAGGIWVPDATNGAGAAALDLGRHLRDRVLDEAATLDAKEVKQRVAHVRGLRSARGTSAALQQLARLDGVRVPPDVWDRQPMLIACENGVVDLTSGALLPFDKELLISRRVAARWAPAVDEAAMPHFMAYLRSSFVNRDGAVQQETIDFMQRWGGYCLTGETGEQKFLMMMGVAGSGKGTWCNLMAELMPEFVRAAASSVFLEGSERRHATELASLFGARIVVASEFSPGQPINTAVLKRLTGQDLITARKMRMDEFSFRPTFKPILLLNEPPTFDEGGNGIWRRMIKLDYPRTFSDQATEDRPESMVWRRDEGLLARLVGERDAIFRWLIEGAIWWHANRLQGNGRGLDVPPDLVAARDEFRSAQDVPGAFVAKCCYQGEPGAGEMVDAVFEKWNTYRLAAREREVPLRQFISEMALRGHATERLRHGVAGLWFSTLRVKQ